MKKKGLIALLIVTLLGGALWLSMSFAKRPFTKDVASFKVNEGESISTVLNRMDNEGLIRSKNLVKLYIKIKGLKTEIKPGGYRFNKSNTTEELVNILNTGSNDESNVKVTIPEGCNIEEIAALLDKSGIVKKDDFIASVKTYKIPNYIKADSSRRYALEGYLFPETYELHKDMKGEEVIAIMLKQFETELKKIEKKANKTINVEDVDKLVTMASIVEKEIESPSERGKAASVFYNRINKQMKLQSCATVLYAMNQYKPKLYDKDLQIESPYNTYKVAGLPAGPICSPGRDCLYAALVPESTNYLYFVSYNNGTHFFTNDYNEFLKVKEKTQGN